MAKVARSLAHKARKRRCSRPKARFRNAVSGMSWPPGRVRSSAAQTPSSAILRPSPHGQTDGSERFPEIRDLGSGFWYADHTSFLPATEHSVRTIEGAPRGALIASRRRGGELDMRLRIFFYPMLVMLLSTTVPSGEAHSVGGVQIPRVSGLCALMRMTHQG